MAYNQLAECFAEYAIGTSFLLLRLFARVKMVGVRGLQMDDLFAVLAVVCPSVHVGAGSFEVYTNETDLFYNANDHYLLFRYFLIHRSPLFPKTRT